MIPISHLLCSFQLPKLFNFWRQKSIPYGPSQQLHDQSITLRLSHYCLFFHRERDGTLTTFHLLIIWVFIPKGHHIIRILIFPISPYPFILFIIPFHHISKGPWTWSLHPIITRLLNKFYSRIHSILSIFLYFFDSVSNLPLAYLNFAEHSPFYC